MKKRKLAWKQISSAEGVCNFVNNGDVDVVGITYGSNKNYTVFYWVPDKQQEPKPNPS